ncbi:MAG TPA: hypothetical protein DCG19_00455, partial [Cryomorphaceae bacterium]|nr:hypothetical protein [Cryomorphaceae bacterium]
VFLLPSILAKMVICAGRPAPQINIQPGGYKLLETVYPNEARHCIETIGPANLNLQAATYSAPEGQNIHLLCVFTDTRGVSWVVQSSNTHFFDPFNGTFDNKWSPQKTFDPMGSEYSFSGLWLVVS